MKKSQMELIIEGCLVEPHFPDNPEKEAKYILKRLEKAGMLPPPITCPILLRKEYVWEPENDCE